MTTTHSRPTTRRDDSAAVFAILGVFTLIVTFCAGIAFGMQVEKGHLMDACPYAMEASR